MDSKFRKINELKIVLASQSPRRRELLKYIAEDFTAVSPECSETVPDGVESCDCAEYLAVQKALSVSEKHSGSMVIGCDTVVILDGEIFGKPDNEAEAFLMLKALSGKTHTVTSGVCLTYMGKTLSFSQSTDVSFYELSDGEILSYIEECRPLDKAGAYGIQDKGALFVKEIKGDYYNVVGLPVAKINRKIKELTVLAERSGG